jgi:hypothetical protein
VLLLFLFLRDPLHVVDDLKSVQAAQDNKNPEPQGGSKHHDTLNGDRWTTGRRPAGRGRTAHFRSQSGQNSSRAVPNGIRDPLARVSVFGSRSPGLGVWGSVLRHSRAKGNPLKKLPSRTLSPGAPNPESRITDRPVLQDSSCPHAPAVPIVRQLPNHSRPVRARPHSAVRCEADQTG